MNKPGFIFMLYLTVFFAGNLGAHAKPKLTSINFLVSGQAVDSTTFADVTVELKFDTEMDSTIIPIVKFGLQEPFHLTVPEGKFGWVNKTQWQGFFTVSNITPDTEDGLYIFKIYGAQDANSVEMDTTFSSDQGLGKSLFICRAGKLSLSVSTLNFGTIKKGQTTTLPLTISNTAPLGPDCNGCLDLHVREVTLPNPPSSFYRLLSTPSTFNVSPGESQTIDIVFDPLDRDDYTDIVIIASGDDGGSASQDTVHLNGSAIGARISLIADSPLNFGKVEIGQDSTRKILVTNVAAESAGHSEKLVIESIFTDAAVYSVSPTNLTLAPGDTEEVQVKFAPTSGISYNSKKLKFQHNDLTQTDKFIWLNGNAIDESPPSEILNLAPDWGGSFSRFVNSNYLPVCWTNPDDPSGIEEIWWKFTTEAVAPASANDTTAFGGRIILSPDSTCTRLQLVNRLFSGYWYCYIWLVDGSGNSGYANAVETSFTYDLLPPGVPRIQDQGRSIPFGQWFTSSSNFDLSFSIPIDDSSGFRDASELRWKYKDPPVNANDYDSLRVFSDANSATRTVTFPFNSEEYCGEDSLYFWLVDSAGNSNADNFEFTRYRFDICPPEIDHIHAADTSDIAMLGVVFRDTLKITDDVKIDTVWMHYRFGGADAEEPPRPMTRIEGTDLYTLEIPVAGVTRRGIEVRVVAIDSIDNRGEAPEDLCDIEHKNNDDKFWFPVRVRIEGDGDFRVDQDGSPVSLIAGADSTNYQLFSIPYVLDSSDVLTVLEDDLGGYDITQWRLFDYNPLQPEGSRFIEGVKARDFNPGRSFFIISRQENIVVDSGPGVTRATVCPDSIQVYDGWNLVATPYNFPVHRDSMTLVNSTSVISLRSFERGWNIVDVMAPWKGYAMYVLRPADLPTESSMYLVVQPKAAPGRVSKKNRVQATSSDEWNVRIAATSGILHDRDNWAGVKVGADVAFDRFEMAEPPVIGSFLKLAFHHPEWNLGAKEFSTDFRPVDSNERVWQFEVTTNQSEAKVDLEFDFSGNLPADAEIFLVDEELQLSQNLRTDRRYSFRTGSKSSRKKLKLIVGSAEYAKLHAGEIGLVPSDFELLPNFPNPFNPETNIRYNLPAADDVTIEVFDLLGRRVTTLVSRKNHQAGYFLVSWNGRNQQGLQVASGVYLYRLRANGKSVVRKMILMK